MGKTSKDRRDIYYRLAKEQGWRARSAFKLLAIDDHFHILDGCQRIVDLCAAPGSWSQVLSQRLVVESKDADGSLPPATILAVDLMQMSPITGVTCMQADITDRSTAEKIVDMFSSVSGSRAQLVLCDGAPDVTNMLDWDEYMQAQLVFAALDLAVAVLEPGGTFVSKVYRTKTIKLVYERLLPHFSDVQCAKPRCCRDSSLEAFVVCRGFIPAVAKIEANKAAGASNQTLAIPFVVCGDSRYDSDRTYSTHLDGADTPYEYLPPVQGPLSAPYQQLYDKRVQERRSLEAVKILQ